MRADRAGDAHLIETRIDSECVFDGNLLHVRRDRVRLPDGGTAIREYIVHPGAALVVPVLADGRFVVVRQFRYPAARVFVEFPAGKLDGTESALDCARRELVEEAGYEASTWAPLGRVHTVVGYSSETIEVYLATGLVQVGNRLDPGEFLDVIVTTEADLVAGIEAGEITDGKTLAAYLLWQRRR